MPYAYHGADLVGKIKLTDKQRFKISKEYAQKQAVNPSFNEEDRKAWDKEYRKLASLEVKRDTNKFDMLMDKVEDYVNNAVQAANAGFGDFMSLFSEQIAQEAPIDEKKADKYNTVFDVLSRPREED